MDLTAAMHAAMPFSAALEVADVAGDDRELHAFLRWGEERCTSGGALHGGALMALADCVGGLLAFLNLPEGASGTTTIESKTNFFRPVTEGRVEAIGRPLHVGRRTIVIDTELRRSDGKLVARVTQTQAVL